MAEHILKYTIAGSICSQDELDLTYFIDYNIQKIKLAIADFEKYLDEKSKENSRMSKLTKNSHHFNDRQIQLLQYLSQKKEESTTVTAHVAIYRVTKVTAIKDLKALVKAKFIIPERRGKFVHYSGTDKIKDLFKDKS